MQSGTFIRSLKVLSYIVLLSMVGAIAYASYITVIYWEGIGV